MTMKMRSKSLTPLNRVKMVYLCMFVEKELTGSNHVLHACLRP